MISVQKELMLAEDQLKNFRVGNRNIISSPALQLEQARLMREVELHTQVYITLKTQHEMVKIEEVQGASMIQILDHPESPTRKIYPRPLRSIVISILFGAVFGVGIIYFKDWIIDSKKKVTLLK